MADLPLTYVAEPDKYVERGKAYASCIGGRRYSVAHQTPGTSILGQTGFVATTPTFLLYQSDSPRRVVLSNFALCQVAPAAGDVLHVAVFIDPTNRYLADGTAIIPQSTISDSPLTAGFSFRYNPVATAAGVGASAPRLLNEWTQPVWVGAVFNPDMHDGVVISSTGSILVYTWAAVTAPTWIIGGFDVLEDG